MQDRSKVINKLALVLLSIVVLELILIGDQVHLVKAIKKKIYLKKLKKILPLLALVKPKKKLILLPIPIPMFKKEPFYSNYVPHQHMMMAQPMSMAGSNEAMAFMMMEPNLVGSIGPPPPPPPPASMHHSESPPDSSSMMMPSMTMTIQSDGTGTMSAIELSPSSSRPNWMATSPTNPNNSMSDALIASRPNKWLEQQQYDYLADEQFSFSEPQQQQPAKYQRPREGDHYYASPWGPTVATTSGRAPLVSPAKYLRNGRLKKQPQQQEYHQQQKQQQQHWASTAMRPVDTNGRLEYPSAPPAPRVKQRTIAMITASTQQRKQPNTNHKFSAPMPVLIIKNNWRPSGELVQQQQQHEPESRHSPMTTDETRSDRENDRLRQAPAPSQQLQMQPKLSKQQEQQIASALEQESLVQVGPARLVPVYQAANGRISMTPPPTMLASASSTVATSDSYGSDSSGELAAVSIDQNSDSNSEVQTNSASRQLANRPIIRGSERMSAIATTTTVAPAVRLTQDLQDQSFERESSPATMDDHSEPSSGHLTAPSKNKQ